MRLDKMLAHLGYGSRKEVKQFIRKGFISINGEIIKDDDFHVDVNEDEIVFLDESVDYQDYQYILINKPQETICSQDRGLYPSVLDLIQEAVLPDTQPVGRLDVDTTGTLLLTNDGQLAHRLISPKHHVEKVYLVQLKEVFNVRYIKDIESGLRLNDKEICMSAKVKVIDDYQIELTLKEGKYHQVKRMMLVCENEVVKLHRILFAGLKTDDLALGEYRNLSEKEIETLKRL